jgi:DNA-binding transcriptional ArsR family regulator
LARSDPTRRDILERLARGPATLDELAQPFGLTLDAYRRVWERRSDRFGASVEERR